MNMETKYVYVLMTHLKMIITKMSFFQYFDQSTVHLSPLSVE